jgi:ketosteroid isomerase-like protein
MAIANNDNLLNQITEAENSHDVEKIIALVTNDIVIEDVPFVPFGIVMKGKDGVSQGYAFFFEATPHYKIEPKTWVTSDKSFASEWVLTATQKETFQVFQHQESAFL